MINLRKCKIEDYKLIAQHFNNPNVLINVSDGIPYPYTELDAMDYIVKVIKNNDFRFTIEFEGEFAGEIGLSPITGHCSHNRAKEIGYWVKEELWGKGIATYVINEVCKKGFQELDLIRIEANVYEYNKSSMRVLEKAGFELEGIQKNGSIKNGEIVDSYKFAIIR